MMTRNLTVLLLSGTLTLAVRAETTEVPKASLFENVVEALTERYYNEDYRENELPGLVKLYRERAAHATGLEEERDVVQAFLSNIPSSHLGLISNAAKERMMLDLKGELGPSFGFELIEYDGKHYAHNVLNGGPADVAGVRHGDRIFTIDGALVDDSPRLGWRTDDAFLPDPPVRGLSGEVGEVLKMRVERRPGIYVDIKVTNALYSTWEATMKSAQVIERDGKRLGYLHLWLIHLIGPDALLQEQIEGPFALCDALIIDLRGRGGSGFMVKRILDLLDGPERIWDKPIVALINGHSRSAKDVLAYEFRDRNIARLVGERTAGAAVPVSSADVGFGMQLHFPTFTLPGHSDRLEFHPIEPHVSVAEVGPYSAGADPIFDAGVVEAARLAKQTPKKPSLASSGTPAPKPKRLEAKRRRTQKTDKIALAPLSADDPAGFDAQAMDVLEKAVDALGGEKTLRRHTARTLRGRCDISGMIEGGYVVKRAAPNFYLQRMDFAGMGRAETGYDGSIGWQISPHAGAEITKDEELADAGIDADFHADLNYKKNHRSIRYLGRQSFSGKDCHELRLTRHTGHVEVRYFDTQSYLMLGMRSEAKTNIGPVVASRSMSEYKAFDGELTPTRTVIDIGGMQEQTITITDVSYEPIDRKEFALPEKFAAASKH